MRSYKKRYFPTKLNPPIKISLLPTPLCSIKIFLPKDF